MGEEKRVAEPPQPTRKRITRKEEVNST